MTAEKMTWERWAVTVMATMLVTGIMSWLSFGREAIVRDVQQDMRLDAAEVQRAELRAQLSAVAAGMAELTRVSDRLVTKIELSLPATARDR